MAQPDNTINQLIHTVRDLRVMLDCDLARIYGVETRVLKQSVRRNLARFPNDFMFELTAEETANLRSQFVISSSKEATLKPNLTSQTVISSLNGPSHGGNRRKPFAFTEMGVAMLSSVLNSETAILLNVEIMRTFTQLRAPFTRQSPLELRVAALEKDLSYFKNRFKRFQKHSHSKPLLPRTKSGSNEIKTIQQEVARNWGIRVDDLISGQRTYIVATARKMAIYLVRSNLSLSYGEIGRHFGGRDHSTVLHAYRKILLELRTNESMRVIAKNIRERLQHRSETLINP